VEAEGVTAVPAIAVWVITLYCIGAGWRCEEPFNPEVENKRRKGRRRRQDVLSLADVVNRRPLIPEPRVSSRVSPCEFFGGQSGTVTGFAPSASVFPCQCHSINAPNSVTCLLTTLCNLNKRTH